MFFESEFICPECKAKKMFYVYGRDNANEKYMIFSSEYKPAQDWQILEDKIRVIVKCDKCWKTNSKFYDFNGKLVGE